MFLKIVQNSQENTCDEAFLIEARLIGSIWSLRDKLWDIEN